MDVRYKVKTGTACEQIFTQNNQRDIYNLLEDGAPHKNKKGEKRRFWRRPKNHQNYS